MLTVLLGILLNIFTPPVDYTMSLAGNFGEPRPHHFHGGLDVKTDNVEGKHIYAIADGYVSRVTVGLYGFGNAIYITHPTGQTSVYCHLRSFSPRIKAALRRYQYRHQTCVADAKFTPLEVPVAQGQFIALSGNSGHSTGPHLHLELHDTKTWDMLDPMEVLGEFINDTVAPKAHLFMAIPQEGGSFNGSGAQQTFARTAQLEAWGPVGFAVWANDYMQGTYNHYGIRETTLLVDGQEVFHSDVNRVPVNLNRMINSWGDYQHYCRSHVWYMKSFVEPGNRLPILRAQHRGIVVFNEERDYNLEYILRDFKGNESHYALTVHGRPRLLAQSRARQQGQPVLRYDRTNSYSRPGMQLVVPYGLITTDVTLVPRVHLVSGALSPGYSFAASSLPLVTDAELSIYAPRHVADPSKLYLSNEQNHYFGGDYRDGWVMGRVRELSGIYRLAYDDQAPRVHPISMKAPRIVLGVTDGDSGIDSWTASVDGRFIVFDAIEKSSSYACELNESWLRPTGQSHRLRFEVTDHCQNTRIFEETFYY